MTENFAPIALEAEASVALSVILITRNQSQNVDRLVSSVLAETTTIEPCEIVLVDSASHDDTVERARRHPIGVLRLPESQVLTAAAGRYVGFHATRGEFMLFLDGDMELVPGWLPNALSVLREHDDVAVVGGQVIDVPPGQDADSVGIDGVVAGELVDVRHAGGAAMYRRAALEQVGSFNPYLCSDEEPELCLRIRRAGFRVVRLPAVIALHHSVPEREFRALFARRRRRLYLGSGQAIRHLLGGPGFWPYVRERGFAFAPGLVLAVGAAAAVISALRRDWRWLAGWLVLVLVVVIGGTARKKSARGALQSLVHRLFIFEGMLKGFLQRPHDPESYPRSAEVVK